ncbi:MAG: 16S rRNA (guanine(966)-N(2))-methyltransferase RsmD [Thiolinea sp.]
MLNKRSAPAAPGQLRIIGGQWRSRRLPVAVVPGLRPTPDRVRETLFNWLQFKVPGARCLDLFAGSGALGFEALSREAAQVVMVEKNRTAVQQLQANAATLRTERADIRNQDALQVLAQLDSSARVPFDLIFLDPPFRQGWVQPMLERITAHGLLAQDGLIYLEYEAELQAELGDFARWGLQVHRRTSAGQVVSVLLQAGS